MPLLRHQICVVFGFTISEINGTAGISLLVYIVFIIMHDFVVFFFFLPIKGKCNTRDVSVNQPPSASNRQGELSCKLPLSATLWPPVNREPSSEPYITASLPL